MEILNDLSLPVDSPNKNILAVVATISLGVGVDVRVKNVVCLGLGSTPENIIQEAGRCQRGKAQLDNSEGLAVFLHKGSVAAIHCPPDSDCRALVTDPLPVCQTKCLFRYFDPEFEMAVEPCKCCFSCRKKDADLGCR